MLTQEDGLSKETQFKKMKFDIRLRLRTPLSINQVQGVCGISKMLGVFKNNVHANVHLPNLRPMFPYPRKVIQYIQQPTVCGSMRMNMSQTFLYTTAAALLPVFLLLLRRGLAKQAAEPTRPVRRLALLLHLLLILH